MPRHIFLNENQWYVWGNDVITFITSPYEWSSTTSIIRRQNFYICCCLLFGWKWLLTWFILLECLMKWLTINDCFRSSESEVLKMNIVLLSIQTQLVQIPYNLLNQITSSQSTYHSKKKKKRKEKKTKIQTQYKNSIYLHFVYETKNKFLHVAMVHILPSYNYHGV